MKKSVKEQYFGKSREIWGLSPVTRVVPNKRAYSRKRVKKVKAHEGD